MTLTMPGSLTDPPALVHLFHEHVTGSAPLPLHSAVPGRENSNPRMGLRSDEDRLPNGEPLTPRELAIVRLLAEGEGIESIGERLHLSTHTVLNHVRNAREKLHAPNRLALVLTAQRLGLL